VPDTLVVSWCVLSCNYTALSIAIRLGILDIYPRVFTCRDNTGFTGKALRYRLSHYSMVGDMHAAAALVRSTTRTVAWHAVGYLNVTPYIPGL
jgi:hypothetical protein